MRSLRALWPVAALLLLVFAPGAGGTADGARTALEEAERLYRGEGPEAALPVFESLAGTYRQADDAEALGQAVRFLGEIHWRLGDYARAGVLLDEALTLARDTGNRAMEGKALNVKGLLHWDLGEFDQAKACFRQGSEIATQLGDLQMAGALLNNLSLVYDEQGDYLQSLEQYQHALELYAGVDFPRGEGDTLGNIGGVNLLLGRYTEALDYYRRALAISERLDSAVSLSQDHGNVGLSLLGLGRVDEAMRHLDRAVDLAAGAGMLQDQAYWLGASGKANLRFGRYDLALQQQQAALEIYTRIDSRTERVEALHDMGRLYLLLGDLNSAQETFQQAMGLARDIGLERGITLNLIALGEVFTRRGDPAGAATSYAQAVERASEAGEIALWTVSLLRLSAAHHALGQDGQAGEEAALALRMAAEIESPGLQAQALVALGDLARVAGHADAALARYTGAATLLEAAPDPELAWRAHHGRGLALAHSNRLEEAIEALFAAIRVIEDVRDRLQQDRFRTGYVQDKYQVYVDLVHLLLEAGREEEAFSMAERLRARSYQDLLERGRLPVPGTSDQQLEYGLKARIETLRQALVEEQRLARPQQRQAAIGVYSAELRAAERAYQDFLDERRRPGDTHSAWNAPTYADVRQVLGADEALIEYVVGDDRLVLFALTREALTAHHVPIRRVDLVNKVDLVRDLIRHRDDARWEKPAASLAEALVGPLIAGGRLEHVRHVYLVPHGSLNYLPFALLPVAAAGVDRSLVERFTLAYLPTAAALLVPHGLPEADRSLLAMAPDRGRLRHSQAEVRAVDALFAPHSRALVGATATESVFKQEAARYRLLHLATHGYFNKLNPLLSGLELEPDQRNDGQLELHEILGLQLEAELVTLSACRTALGSGHFAEIPAGDDFVGLTRAFLYAGSRSVLATLWEVDDASTAGFMTRFYTGLKSNDSGKDKADALADAQRAMLASPQFGHPYYWAPFVLVGDGARLERKRT